jgi:arginine decarboxylase
LCDITCDSDGQIDKFVDLRDVKQALELHGVNSEPYYLAIPLVGAYQESLGMDHNLLGSANEAHFLVDDAGRPHLDKVVRGAALSQVLNAAGYAPHDLMEGFRKAVEAAEGLGKIAHEEGESLAAAYESALEGYTYLED